MKILFFFGVLLLVVHTATSDCCGISTVSVSGTGKVSGTPDIATFTVSASETRPTTKEATKAVNDDINAVLQALANNGVQKRDISTGQISVGPQYDYPNGTQTLKGQQASQSLNVKLRDISADGASVGKVLDALNAINDIQISSVNFDIDNKKPLERQARALAYNDAKSKAVQYSQLSSLLLGNPLTINEGASSNSPVYRGNGALAFASADSTGAQVPLGQTDVSVDVNIIWKLGA